MFPSAKCLATVSHPIFGFLPHLYCDSRRASFVISPTQPYAHSLSVGPPCSSLHTWVIIILALR